MSLTRPQTLRSGNSLWADTGDQTLGGSDTLPDTRFDAVVVGGGVSGALMADALVGAGRSVLVIERRRAVLGSTLASTAMIQHEIDTPLVEMARLIGPEDAASAWRRSAASVEGLARRVQQAAIDCDWRPRSALYLAGSAYGADTLRREAEARRAIGLSVEVVEADALARRFGIDRPLALVSHCSASCNPARMTAGFLKRALEGGARLLEGAEVADLAERDDEVTLTLGDGRAVRAGAAIFCTGYQALARLGSPSHQVVSTWAAASRPGLALPGWLEQHLVWEGADPYLYFRSTPDGRVILGGEDEPSPDRHTDEALRREKAATLSRKLRELTGIDIGEPEHVWAAAFGATDDGLARVGAVPGLSRTYAVMGFGGNGITGSQMASEIILAALEGREDPDAGLYAFERDAHPQG